MAKTDSLIELKGTFGNITFVKSSAYGNHVRRKRGTVKEAKLNDALQASGKRLLTANVPAKIFADAIKGYRRGLERGSLWRRLLSAFRHQLNQAGGIDFSILQPFEIHTKYPFDRFLNVIPSISFNAEGSVLDVTITYPRHPSFEESSFIDGYQLTTIAVFPDLKNKTATTLAAPSPVLPLEGVVNPLTAQFAIPPNATAFLVCVKIEGCTKGEVDDLRTTMGMKMVSAGSV